VVLNQVALAPVVLAFVFSWNLCWKGEAGGIPSKIRRDLVPSMINGEGVGWGVGCGARGLGDA